MNIGLILLSICLTGLVIVALRRREPAGPVLKRMVEQFAKLVPRMLCALLGAGFLAQLIPQQAIAALLGEDAGLIALPIAALDLRPRPRHQLKCPHRTQKHQTAARHP